MTTFTVPRIDIAPYLDPAASKDADPACAAVAARIDAACAGVGFLQVVGHGIPADAIDGLAAAIDQFFGAPTEFKRTLRRPGENRGYTPPKSESLSMSLGVAPANAMNDFYEAFTLGTEATAYPHADLPVDDYPDNSWPDLLGFRDAVETYFREVTVLSRALLRACSDALGLGTGYFDHLVDHSIDTLKMNNYALAPERSNWTAPSPAWVRTPTSASSPCCGPIRFPASRYSAPTPCGTRCSRTPEHS